MDWKWDEKPDVRIDGKNRKGFFLRHNHAAIAYLWQMDGKWIANYRPGGYINKPVVTDVPIEAETLEEAKAVTIALMRMS